VTVLLHAKLNRHSEKKENGGNLQPAVIRDPQLAVSGVRAEGANGRVQKKAGSEEPAQ
jgi:hypothetical protein